MTWRVLYEGSGKDTQRARSILDNEKIDYIVEKASFLETNPEELPLLLAPEGTFLGLKLIDWYAKSVVRR